MKFIPQVYQKIIEQRKLIREVSYRLNSFRQNLWLFRMNFEKNECGQFA